MPKDKKASRDTRTKAELIAQVAEEVDRSRDWSENYQKLEVERDQKDRQLRLSTAALGDATNDLRKARQTTELLLAITLAGTSPVRFWLRLRDSAKLLGFDPDSFEGELTRAMETVTPSLAAKTLRIVKNLGHDEPEKK